MTVAVVFHSQSGHVERMAERLAGGIATEPGARPILRDVASLGPDLWAELGTADAIVFGCPTYMGGPSSVFKAFAEASLPIWASRGWTGKVAAGFTHSQAMSGDKLNTLQYLSLLAAQHGMLWTNLDLLPGWCWDGATPDDLNRLGAWLGAMGQSNGDGDAETNPRESDLLTAEHLGAQVAATARVVRVGRLVVASDREAAAVASVGRTA